MTTVALPPLRSACFPAPGATSRLELHVRIIQAVVPAQHLGVGRRPTQTSAGS